MISPLDIQNKTFKKKLRGYDPNEVDKFLNDIMKDYEEIYRQNIELKDKISLLTNQIKRYSNLEETLKSTLVLAQTTADEVTTTSRKKAELIIDDADARAREIISEAQENVKSIESEYENLKREIFTFKTRYKSFINAQLFSLDEFYKGIEEIDKEEQVGKDESLKND